MSRLRGRWLDAGWLWGHDAAVLEVARGIAQKRDFAALPVLADALEEAGCQNPKILEHCRHPGPHGQCCWVLDGLLDEG